MAATPQTAAMMRWETTEAAGAADEGADEIQVDGVRSTLSQQETHDTLSRKMDALAECFTLPGRRLRQVGGRVELRIIVLADGAVRVAHPSRSTVGNREVERCIREVVRGTLFPSTRGGGEAEVAWSFAVDPPASVREPAIWDPGRVARVVDRRGMDVLERCDAPDGVRVTAYVSRRGRVLSAGAAYDDQVSDEVLDCVASQVQRWQLPVPRRVTKVTFGMVNASS